MGEDEGSLHRTKGREGERGDLEGRGEKRRGVEVREAESETERERETKSIDFKILLWHNHKLKGIQPTLPKCSNLKRKGDISKFPLPTMSSSTL